MDDLIFRQAAIDAHCELCDMNDKCICIYCKDIDMFESLPTAEKKGRWVWKKHDEETGIDEHYFCSECGFPQGQIYTKFCAVCGARMEESDETY